MYVKLQFVFLLGTALFLLNGCGSSTSPASEDSTGFDLKKRWYLKPKHFPKNVNITPEPFIDITKNSNHEMGISGFTGCNELMGKAILVNDHIKIKSLSVTEKACLNDDLNMLEQRILKVLQSDKTVLSQDLSSYLGAGMIAIDEDKGLNLPAHHPDRMLRFYNVHNELNGKRWFLSTKHSIEGIGEAFRPYIAFTEDAKNSLVFSAFLGCRPIVGNAKIENKKITFSYEESKQILPRCKNFNRAQSDLQNRILNHINDGIGTFDGEMMITNLTNSTKKEERLHWDLPVKLAKDEAIFTR